MILRNMGTRRKVSVEKAKKETRKRKERIDSQGKGERSKKRKNGSKSEDRRDLKGSKRTK